MKKFAPANVDQAGQPFRDMQEQDNRAQASRPIAAQRRDNRPEARQLNAYSNMSQNSARAMQFKAMQAMMNKPAVHYGSSVVQRQTLDKAIDVGAAGLRKTATKFPVIGEYQHPDAELYANVISREAADRSGAMVEIAKSAGQIGQHVSASARNVVKHNKEPFKGRFKSNPGAYFYSHKNRGSDAEKAIDPFTHGTYCAITGGKYLVLMYQHTYDLDGYITGVEDGTTENEGEYKRTIAASMKYGKQQVDPASDVKYEQLHARTAGGNLKALAEGTGAENFDAVAKLAGEGARFQWVRNNIAVMTDDTVFTAPKSGPVPALTITFSNLWSVWKKWFNGQYNISDDQITAVMRRKWTAIPHRSAETDERIKAL